MRFGKALNFSLPFCARHLVAWPATLHIILKNDAKSSFFKPCCNMFGQCLHIFINQANSAFSLLLLDSFFFQLVLPRCHLPHVPSECFFWERQIDGIPVARETVDPRRPVDLDQVPFRVVEVEGE